MAGVRDDWFVYTVVQLLVFCLVMFWCFLTADSGAARHAEQPLHKCLETPIAHQLWLRHSDDSRVFIGTMPCEIKGITNVAKDDRLITGLCK